MVVEDTQRKVDVITCCIASRELFEILDEIWMKLWMDFLRVGSQSWREGKTGRVSETRLVKVNGIALRGAISHRGFGLELSFG